MNNIDFINLDLPLFLKDKNLTDIEKVTDKINAYYQNKEKPFFNTEAILSTCLLLEFNYSESNAIFGEHLSLIMANKILIFRS